MVAVAAVIAVLPQLLGVPRKNQLSVEVAAATTVAKSGSGGVLGGSQPAAMASAMTDAIGNAGRRHRDMADLRRSLRVASAGPAPLIVCDRGSRRQSHRAGDSMDALHVDDRNTAARSPRVQR
ncbi:MAG TPA: hypothetical protein VGD37_22920 [Kofleriaceae bacterium]